MVPDWVVHSGRGYFRAELIKEAFNDHLRGCVEESLAHCRNGTPHFDGTLVLYVCPTFDGNQREQAIALHEPDLPSSLYDQPETGGGILIGDAYGSVEQSGDAGHHHLHFHVVLEIADLLQGVTTGHAFSQHHRILQQCVGALLRNRQHARSGNFHEALVRATEIARRACTRARWRR